MGSLTVARLASGVAALFCIALLATASCGSPDFEVPDDQPLGDGGIAGSSTCTNGERDEDEADVDCGGECDTGCANGFHCNEDSDCLDESCIGDTCQAATCLDEDKADLETDVDCGGPDCPPCEPGQGCAVDTDCTSMVCDVAVCAMPSCDDQRMNADETDVDCGGGTCDTCPAGMACVEDGDCSSGECREEDGVCAVVCAAGSGDCDNDNECETNTALDPEHCGGCNQPCELDNAVTQCVAGGCEILECEEPYDDCDGDPSNGCEVNLETDPENCGVCFNACIDINGDPTCDAGQCGIECVSGFEDCDDELANGCEKDTGRDVNNCGECDYPCPEEEGKTAFCDAGGCGLTACDDGLGDCDGDGEECETDLTSGIEDCGSCGNLCVVANGTPTCDAGTCAIESCNDGWEDCNGDYSDGCEAQLDVNLLHCGACDNECGTCQAGDSDCEVPNGRAWCVDGACEIRSCDSGFIDCNDQWDNGCEIDFTSDQNNCGGCAGDGGQDCDTLFAHATAECADGACEFVSCSGSWRDCANGLGDGCETNINTSFSHCGACGDSCSNAGSGTGSCSSGACSVSCGANFLSCNNENNNRDGCETDVQSDLNNCGACGTTCAFCDAGECLTHLDIAVSGTSGKQEASVSAGCGQTELTLDHSLSNGSALEYDYRLLILGLGVQANANMATPCQLTYGGQNFTQVTTNPPLDGVGGWVYIMKEQQLRAISGNQLVVRIPEHSSYGKIAAHLVELRGVDQTTPLSDQLQNTTSSFVLNPNSGAGLTVGDQASLVYSFIARRQDMPTSSYGSFAETIGDARAAGGYFFANDDDPQTTETWGGAGFSHTLSAIAVQRVVTACQTGC